MRCLPRQYFGPKKTPPPPHLPQTLIRGHVRSLHVGFPPIEKVQPGMFQRQSRIFYFSLFSSRGVEPPWTVFRNKVPDESCWSRAAVNQTFKERCTLFPQEESALPAFSPLPARSPYKTGSDVPMMPRPFPPSRGIDLKPSYLDLPSRFFPAKEKEPFADAPTSSERP